MNLERMLHKCERDQWSINDLDWSVQPKEMSKEDEMAVVQYFKDMSGIERLAKALFAEQRRRTTDPTLRRIFETFIVDEERHAQVAERLSQHYDVHQYRRYELNENFKRFRPHFERAITKFSPEVANAPSFELADTGGQIELARAADLASVDVSVIRALNPGQLRWATSPDQDPQLLLPPGSGERFSQGVAQLTPDDRVRWQHYRIESGDNLIRIAKKFDTEVGLLRQVNGIRGSMIRAGDTLMIPMGSAWASSLAMAAPSEPTRRGYRVRQGDSLYRIAGKFNVSVNDIIAWNALDPADYLQPGQRLTLYVSGG